MTDAVPPAIVIAAGGAGRRIGGGKPGRLLAGRRLIDHALDWARRSSDCVALSVAADTGPIPDVFDLPQLPDHAPDLGPISGLSSAVAFAAARGRSHVLLVACDMPLLPDDLAPRLSGAIGPAGAALPWRAGFLHPLAGLWRTEPAAVEAWIAAGGRALRGYAAEAGLVEVHWPDDGLDPFLNVNTIEDLTAVEGLLRTRSR